MNTFKKIAVGFILVTHSLWATDFESQYTSINQQDCHPVDSATEDAVYGWNCPSFSNIDVKLEGDDLIIAVDLIRQGIKYPLAIWSVVQPSEAPMASYLGNKIEWRYKVGQKNSPVGTIVRAFATEDSGKPDKKNSYLVVSKIVKNKICVVGKVAAKKGRNQNELARKMVEQSANMPCVEYETEGNY